MRLILPILAALALLAGCGGNQAAETTPPARTTLSEGEYGAVLDFTSASMYWCSTEVPPEVAQPPDLPTPADLIDPALAVFRAAPEALGNRESGGTVREEMIFARRDLAPCETGLANIIDVALEAER